MKHIALFVHDGNSDLYNLVRCISIEKLLLGSTACVSLASEILHTLNKLKQLFLMGTYTGRCDLKLPASLKCIRLDKVECSSDWLCSVLITICSLGQPVELQLGNVVLQSSKETHSGEPPAHVSDLRSEILSCDMSNIMIIVKYCSKELFDILRDTSIGILELEIADCVSLASEIMFTLSKQTHLILSGTYTGRSFRKLPALLTCFCLKKVECSYEWLCILLITLSLLTHPVTCVLWDVVLQPSEETREDDSHLHVSDLRSEILSCDLSNITILMNNVSKELLEILRHASIGILDIRTAESLSSDIVHTLNKLKQIYLRGTYTGRCDLRLPASLQCISLQKVEC
ncbi:hypothetical protein DPMN_058500 [Dreissena polymorpha]|uniref:Uncharacterized protein n=1 Tax=Dreissena polymorpha TaxID=45954 RepID=A0A9D4HDR8_DREPO|nr:hypothetical protein DPMN_058500 [Dreissena polymorpha]